MAQGAGLPILSNWQNFYMITGTAAATLTGLMFIVITLMAGIDSQVTVLDAGVSAFNTPTVVHFCTVLLMALMLNVPWRSSLSVSLVLGLLGLGELIYFLTVIPRVGRVPDYQTPWKDWLWYITVPIAAHIVLVLAAVSLQVRPALGLDLISAVMVTLLFIGIRNAWDLVTFLAVVRGHPRM